MTGIFRLALTVTLATGISFLIGCSKPSETLDLQVKWPVGKKFVYELTLNQVGDINLPLMPEPIRQTTTQLMEYAVSVISETTGGGRELEMEFTRMTMNVDAGMMKMSFDSDNPPSEDSKNPQDAFLAAFGGMIGSKLKFSVDQDGEVSVEGRDEFIDKILGGAPPQAAQMAEAMFNEDQLTQMIMPKVFPGRPVSTGESWPIEISQDLGPMGKMTVNNQYKFSGMELHDGRNCAILNFSGTMTSEPTAEGDAGGMMGMNMKIKGGANSGTSWFDPELGQFVDTEVDQQIEMGMETPGLPGDGMQESVMKMDQKVAIRIKGVVDL